MTAITSRPGARRTGISAFVTAAVLAFGVAASALPTQPSRIQVGDTAPDLALRTPDGTLHRLSDLRGKQPVVLVFFRGVW